MKKKEFPLVSIITPCYNCASFVSRAIESALSQTYLNTEIILVDNNSTDDTITFLRNYQKRYPEKITVLQEFKKGAPAARNKGLSAAKGEWIQFLDADDELLPDKIEKQINLAVQNNCQLIIGNSIHHKKYISRKMRACKQPWVALINSQLGDTCANLWQTNLLKRVGGWDEHLTSSQEYNLLFKILKENPVICYDEEFNTIVYHQITSISKSADQQKRYQILTNARVLRQEIANYLLEHNLFGKTEEQAFEKFIFRHVAQYKYLCPAYYRDFKYLLQGNKSSLLLKWSIMTQVELKPLIYHAIDLIR